MTRVMLLVAPLVLMGFECGGDPDLCDVTTDADGDGADSMACGGTDCDDTDGERAPGRAEVCDAAAHDEDCDPATFGDRDQDGDGSVDAACANADEAGTVRQGDDCDDLRADVHLGVPEVCDGLDNDCNGEIDEGVSFTFHRDQDLDGHGTAFETTAGCAPPPGFSFTADDCDDERADVNPGTPEACDGVDNDCDGAVDEDVLLTLYVDDDHDGFGTGEAVEGCAESSDRAILAGDCDDSNAALVNGSMRCVDALQYEICRDGTWTAPTGCPTQQCLAQPNGVGTCR